MILNYRKMKKKNYQMLVLSYVASVLIMFIVRLTGGTPNVYANLMYVPISVAALYVGKRHGTLHAVFSGVMLGPVVSLGDNAGFYEQPSSWIIRTAIYVVISMVIGDFTDFNEKRLISESTYDNHTGLKKISALRNSLQNEDKQVALIMLTISNLRSIFSTFGYDFTSEFIRVFASHLNDKVMVYPQVEVYRLVENGFAIKVVNVDSAEGSHLASVVQDLRDIHKSIINIANVPVYTELIFGISANNLGKNSEESIKHASLALNYAQDVGLDHYSFEQVLEDKYALQNYIFNHFRSALRSSELKLAYQNIYRSSDNRLYAREFLVRWEDSGGNFISPATFIPLIEKTDLIHDLTKFVIDEVIEYVSYTHEHEKNIVASINFSSKDFNHSNIDYLVDKIKEFGINPNMIQVEITEESLLNTQSLWKVIAQLKNLGVRIVIDDFGTGYSSFDMLAKLSIDGVKIDKSVISNINNDFRYRKLCSNLVDFCKTFNISTVAEGVEFEHIAEACRDIGIDYLQGFLLSKPQLIDASYKRDSMTNQTIDDEEVKRWKLQYNSFLRGKG